MRIHSLQTLLDVLRGQLEPQLHSQRIWVCLIYLTLNLSGENSFKIINIFERLLER